MGNSMHSTQQKKAGERTECHLYSNNEQATLFFLKFIKYANIPITASWDVDEIIVALVLSHHEQEINAALENYSGTLSTLQSRESGEKKETKPTTKLNENMELQPIIDNDRTPLLDQEDVARNYNENKTLTNQSTHNDGENPLVSVTREKIFKKEVVKEEEKKTSQRINSIVENKRDPSKNNMPKGNTRDRLLVIIRGKNSKPSPIDIKTKYSAVEVIDILHESEDFYKVLEENDRPKSLLQTFVLPGTNRECHIYINNEQAKQFFLKFLKYANIQQTASWSVDEIVVVLVISHFEADINCALDNYSGTLSTLQSNEKNHEREATEPECVDSTDQSKIEKDSTPLQVHEEKGDIDNKNENLANPSTSAEDKSPPNSTTSEKNAKSHVEKEEEMDTPQKIDSAGNTPDHPCREKHRDKKRDRLLFVMRKKTSTKSPVDLKAKYHAVEVIEFPYEGEDFHIDLKEYDLAKDALHRHILQGATRECHIYSNNEKAIHLFLKIVKYADIPHTASWSIDKIIVVLVQSHLEQEISSALENYSGTLSTLQSRNGNEEREKTKDSDCTKNVEHERNSDNDCTHLQPAEYGASTNNTNKSFLYPATRDKSVETKERKEEEMDTSQKIDTAENMTDPSKSEMHKGNTRERLLVIIRGKNSKPSPIDLKTRFNAEEVIEILYDIEDFYRDLEENDMAKNILKGFVLKVNKPGSGFQLKVQSVEHVTSNEAGASKHSETSYTEGSVTVSCFPIVCPLLAPKKEFNVIFDENCRNAFSNFLEHYLPGWNAKWIEDMIDEKKLRCKPTLLLCLNLSRLDDDVNAAIQKCSNWDAPVMLVIIQPCADEQEIKSFLTNAPEKPIVRCTYILYSSDLSRCNICDVNKKAEKDILMFLSQYRK